MNERMQNILNLAYTNGEISIKELASLCGVTEITVRRDIEELSAKGLLVNKRGIISVTSTANGIIPFTVRSFINSDVKDELAKYAASLIKDNQVVFLDGGSTVIPIVDYITTNNNIIVTCGLRVAWLASQKGIRSYILPGFVNSVSNSSLSDDSIDLLDKMNFDLALIGASGINKFYNFSTNSPDSASIKSKAIKQSKQTYIIADSTKFSSLGFSKFASFSDATLITDKEPTENLPGLNYIIPEVFKK